MPYNHKPLTVYKASAGSGKTFTLAVEYIKLLIKDPQNYRYILAVTFTNKATDEMKKRILSQLYGIANELGDSEAYMERVRAAFPEMSDLTIRERAKQAMELILHHYHYFRVETIDSFFQSILRNLARELGLTANLQVGLNDQEVESQAVDNIIDGIQQDNDPLLEWIMDFVTEKVNDEKNWNVIGQIKDFGKNIFKDFYKDHKQELHRVMNVPGFFKQYTSRLRDMKQKAFETMAGFAEEYQRMAQMHGLCDAHYSHGKQNAPGYFKKLAEGNFTGDKIPNSYVAKGIANHEKLLKKSDVDTVFGQAIVREVGPLLVRAETERRKQSMVVNSVELTLKNLNELRLLGRIEEEVSAINTANNNYPLSNTQKLLRDLIDKQDSPFIYEKTGGQLKYIMIDEFQDTSTLQWENFKVLLDDCLAHNSGSLIVGDVKQSIYRWRNGDWRLLQNLTPEGDARIRINPLDTNYRSKRNIIRFNNVFFKLGAKITSEEVLGKLIDTNASQSLLQEALEIREAYADVAQKVSEKYVEEDDSMAGSVTIRLLPQTDYEENTVAEVKQTLEHLLSSGIPPKKIAVLVRKNKHIQELADYFQQHPICVNGEEQMASMISDEAFRLDASLAVCTIVRAMYLLIHPDDRIVAAELVKAYRKICDEELTVADSILFVERENLTELLPEAMLNRWESLLSTPLMDLAEQLYLIFELNRLDGQSAYVCAFFDQMARFTQNHIAGINEFVEEWESNISRKTIHSDEVNGIRLLTIHKSKGLEFDNVIIPYCDWNLEMTGEILWMKPRETPYSDLPVIPVRLSASKLQDSIYKEDYLSEHLKNHVDNLNMLYVAFTRAGNNLFIIGKKDSSQYPSALIRKVIDYYGDAPDYQGNHITPDPKVKLEDLLPGHSVEDHDDGVTTFRFGTLCQNVEKEKKLSLNVFEHTEEGVRMDIRNYDAKAVFRQSNESARFMTPDDEQEALEKRDSYLKTGNVLHLLFASIRTTDDVDRAIDQLEFDGILYDRTMTRQELRHFILRRIQTPVVSDWFDPKWQVFNECAMITEGKEPGNIVTRRPDRVICDGHEMKVIDFKTGKECDKHHIQVRRYMQYLHEMGYENVSGYLWYIRPNRIVEIKKTI